jgi:alanine dehydrogenase
MNKIKITTAGVFGSSLKENEFRLPIHPTHIAKIPEHDRKQMLFEVGYGKRFGFPDAEIAALTAGVVTRDELFRQCNLLILPKPTEPDLRAARPGATICGWVHCVQQSNMTQAAIDQRLTVVAWESMNVSLGAHERPVHVFHRNNEIAGYCAVLHAFQIMGIAGCYGSPRQVTMISLGSVSRGAIVALQALGVRQITVLTRRVPELISDKIVGCDYGHLQRISGKLIVRLPGGAEQNLADILAESDVIVNGILQDTNDPLMYATESEIKRFKRDALIIDISCDKGMGFPFAKPTSFEHPVFQVGEMTYYAVDHTPSYLWNSATWEISSAFLPWLPVLLKGPENWLDNQTISRALEIRDGVIMNARILAFQKRAANYPHELPR